MGGGRAPAWQAALSPPLAEMLIAAPVAQPSMRVAWPPNVMRPLQLQPCNYNTARRARLQVPQTASLQARLLFCSTHSCWAR